MFSPFKLNVDISWNLGHVFCELYENQKNKCGKYTTKCKYTCMHVSNFFQVYVKGLEKRGGGGGGGGRVYSQNEDGAKPTF